MGGEIFVGVRLPDGTEHLSFRWTNSTAWEMQDPDFHQDGPLLRKWMARATKRTDWGHDRLLTRFRKAGYGALLLDLKQPGLWEENGYTDFSSMSCATFDSAFEEELDIIVRLEDRGWLGKIWARNPEIELMPAQRSAYLEHARAKDYEWFDQPGKVTRERPYSLVRVDNLRRGFEVSPHRDDDRNTLKRAREWAAARGWKSR